MTLTHIPSARARSRKPAAPLLGLLAGFALVGWASAEQAAPAPHAHETASPDAAWQAFKSGNRRFVEGRPAAREYNRTRVRLAGGQHPSAVVLGCSDSRVSPELVFDQNLGDVFVIRTAGHAVDPVALGSIEYAVEHLHTRLVIVLGHDRCGAVTAAVDNGEQSSPNIKAMLTKILPAILPLRRPGLSSEALLPLAIEANARHVASELVKESELMREAQKKSELRIIPAVYRLATGEVVDLQKIEGVADEKRK